MPRIQKTPETVPVPSQRAILAMVRATPGVSVRGIAARLYEDLQWAPARDGEDSCVRRVRSWRTTSGGVERLTVAAWIRDRLADLALVGLVTLARRRDEVDIEAALSAWPIHAPETAAMGHT